MTHRKVSPKTSLLGRSSPDPPSGHPPPPGGGGGVGARGGCKLGGEKGGGGCRVVKLSYFKGAQATKWFWTSWDSHKAVFIPHRKKNICASIFFLNCCWSCVGHDLMSHFWMSNESGDSRKCRLEEVEVIK